MSRIRFNSIKGYNILKICTLSFLIILVNCKKVDPVPEIKIETYSIIELGQTFCIVNGKIIDMGGEVINQHGFCYSDSENPTVLNQVTRLGEASAIGTFSDTLTKLVSNTTYYFRAYAQTADNVYYDDQKSFTTISPSIPVVSTTSISHITQDSALGGGKVITDGGASITSRGVCWSISQGPTVSDSHSTDGAGLGVFSSILKELSCGTVYYAKAYATNSAGTGYGEQISFTTIECIEGMPLVTTAPVTNITETTALGGGNVESDGGTEIIARGICWSAFAGPTIDDGYTTNGSEIGSYSGAITGLTCNQIYYVRAYATNQEGTAYGSDVSFTTSNCLVNLPSVTTSSVNNITMTTAQAGGVVAVDNGGSIIEKGVCWSTDQNPTILDLHSSDGSELGSFTSTISGLSCGTTYYVRAYATNSSGTAYGLQESFNTKSCIVPPTVFTTSISNIFETTAQGGGNVSDDGGGSIIERGVCWSTDQNPTTSDPHSSDGSEIGSYTSTITGLSCGTTYYVRAYATNSSGTAYGLQVSFNTISCVVPPTVSTISISSISETAAQGGGNVADDGGGSIIERGVCWSTDQNPTTSDPHSSDGSEIGSYTSTITGLSCGTRYYVRAYATNSAGINYGEQVEFSTDNCTSVIDYEGNVYQIVTIGDQTWMQENLKVTRYSDGATIPLVESSTNWNNLTETGKGYCFYENNLSNKDSYGNLYSWAAIMNGAGSSDTNPSGVQGVCPVGWHLPSDAEWDELIDHLGGSSIAGGKLKETGTLNWSSPNTGASNESGFTALPGGIRLRTGGFDYISNSANFWSTSTDDAFHAWVYYLGYATAETLVFNSYKDDGFYVRCIKNE